MFEDLHNKYYALFSDLYSNRAVLPEKQYNAMVAALNAEYQRELQILLNDIQLTTARQVFQQRVRLGLFLPRRFLWWRNKTAKVYISEVMNEFIDFLKNFNEPAQEQEPEPDEHPVVIENQFETR